MDRIIQSYMEAFLKSQQIVEKDKSRKFEIFASYCAVENHYSETYNISDIIVGKGGDCGIDAIAIIINGTLITSKEEIDDILEMNKTFSDISFIFIQAKTSSNFDYGDMGTFGAGVKDVFSEQPQMVRNSSIAGKSAIVEYIFSKATYIKRKPTCYMYYITTGKWQDDINCTGRMNMAISDLKDLNLFDDVRYIPVDSSLLQKYYRSTIDAVETEIEFENKILLPDIKNVKQSYLGIISYKEYLKLIVGENGEIRKSVFYDNVRDFQGDNPVNHEVAETVCSDPQKFVLFNNGVTIICKKMTNIGKKFTLSDYQIVNGCQTSHVLYNHRDDIEHDLQIPIKLIETEDDETVNRIIKATNRQTEVSDEQLIALNEFHRKLEAFYGTFTGNDKLYYERRSKQYNYGSDIEKVRIVSIVTQIKSVASMFYDKPNLASRYYSRLLSSITGIFSEDHKMLPYYTCAFTLYRLEYLYRNKSLPSNYRKFRYHILMMIKYRLVDSKIPQMNSGEIEKICQTILKVVKNNNKLVELVTELVSIIDKYVDDINSTEPTKSSELVEKLKLELTM
ncbi:AIPR protein [Anaerovibrio lipolyticus DSM 3074]|uniref:AIPR protein n=1 Tax=Anaerovibrio lipolyticus DSM 3074 TaxID=1120997 RepID=A0A1M6FFW8_9FIRM|nr:AIPR family protein [Anaerovibrio lipolyticus]SHI96575.1 AIPR protein [Anaerovibrio lipolyticus DSM 3074]